MKLQNKEYFYTVLVKLIPRKGFITFLSLSNLKITTTLPPLPDLKKKFDSTGNNSFYTTEQCKLYNSTYFLLWSEALDEFNP